MDSIQQESGSDSPFSQTSWRGRGRAIAVGFGLVVAALLIGAVLSSGPLLVGEASFAVLTATIVLSEASYALTGWLYLQRWFSETVSLEMPTLREAGWVIVSTLLMLGIATLIGAIATTFDVQLGRLDQDLIAGTPTMALVMAALSFVLIAPAEEYLFRGVIQRRLMRSMRSDVAIVTAAFLFVIPHAIGYLGGVQGVVLLSAVPFLLAIIMGVLYERFDNLSVPILTHGCYNATLFVTTYITLV